ncbi:MAG: tRNA preQ1(34) S-adenosylmethionine ribosyltransferase-isomerase QueA [Elusimicrobiota bacterium]
MGGLTPLKNFDFFLPGKFIAQMPAKPRDLCRMMVVGKREITDDVFGNLINYVSPGDCLVINTSKVLPAKMFCKKTTGGKVELLFLRKHTDSTQSSGSQLQRWAVLSRDNVRDRELLLLNGVSVSVIDKTLSGEYIIELDKNVNVIDMLLAYGEMPLPPYIKRRNAGLSVKKMDFEHYQTVYAKEFGSIASPTAGLHFTQELLEKIKNKGVEVVEIVVHIGWATFKPVKSEYIEEHKMYPEGFEITPEASDKINNCRNSGARVFAVGTSVVRALETCSDEGGRVTPRSGTTELFIYPGYRFKVIDAMITNFHLPKSTPYIMVCTFAGITRIKESYEQARQLNYRFYSYGDVMLMLENRK